MSVSTSVGRLLFLTNGHGEDEIAGLILKALAPSGTEREAIAAWPMVGAGHRYARASIPTIGPPNRLPSEGFGTVSLGAFWRDLRAGFLETYLTQARFARELRGTARAIVAIGDIVPLAAAWRTGAPSLFYSSAKSARYGGTDGHNAIERALMRRMERVYVRDARTARQLGINRVEATFPGNPMMDGVAGGDGTEFLQEGRLTIALIPGTRGDAEANAHLLLEATGLLPKACGLVPAHDGLDLQRIAAQLPPGWSAVSISDTELSLSHGAGAGARIVKGRFADVLAAATLATGMAGTGNEQAIGRGLPLVAVPGAGNQGHAYLAMKMRYYGKAAISAQPNPQDIARRLQSLAGNPKLCREMSAAGRELMGAPGASAAIAAEIRALMGWDAPNA